jgi:hypothetical protein
MIGDALRQERFVYLSRVVGDPPEDRGVLLVLGPFHRG